MDRKKILFLTGTRADYGKMKSLMMRIENSQDFELHIFITGMHTLREFGFTKNEIIKDGFKNIQVYMNQIIEEPMDLVLANTINGFSRYIRELNPDMIVVHGDRVEALAGAISGALNNILVAHIEGGEVSGTIDESLRHSISKLSHIHFVSNTEAKNRLVQLGENPKNIYVIGSADLDVILEKTDLNFDEIKDRYGIGFEEYSVLMYHPVTTDLKNLNKNIKNLVDGVLESGKNYIVINPNNDMGYKTILNEYKRFIGNDRIKMYPSIRFEYFLEILKRAEFLIGNSSAGVHEAPVIGIPTINIGSRQDGRYFGKSIINVKEDKKSIVEAIEDIKNIGGISPANHFGNGNSNDQFMEIIGYDRFWKVSKQKKFINL